MGDWHRDGCLRVHGTTSIDSKRLSPEYQNEMFDLMAAPLQKHVMNAANSQIESTKKILNMPAAKGLLWVASDGNVDLQPDAVWFLLTRILQKKRENGTPGDLSLSVTSDSSHGQRTSTGNQNKLEWSPQSAT